MIKEEWQSWLIAPVLKTGVPERVPGVRIPLPPHTERANFSSFCMHLKN